MKTGKIIMFSIIFGIGLLGCEKDDTQETLVTPRVDFSFTPTALVAGDEVVFNAEPAAGSSEITTWAWNFGDENSTSSTETDPTYIYENAGTYDVYLQVSDAAGNVHRTTKTITVTKAEFPASLVWEFSTNTPVSNINDGSSSPVIGDDGTIYYTESRAGENSKVVAVTDQGDSAELKWASGPLGGELPNAPSIGPDGNILINAWVVDNADNAINKLSAADGTILWSGGIGTDVSNSTPAVDSQGNSYHGSRAQGANGGVYSWTSEGEKRWEITGVGAFYSSPVISNDESTVYFLNTNEGMIWAVNAADGSPKWEAPVGEGSGVHGSSLSMNADGTIYYTTNAHVVAITDNGETGAIKWSVEIEGASNSGVVIGPGGDLYSGATSGLYSFNPEDGAINWVYDIEIAESVPAVDVNGNVYVGSVEGILFIISETGALEKEFELTNNVVNSPTITSDGTIYVEAYDGEVIKLFKIAVEESGPANSPWPMKGQNIKNTGRAN